jgi:hypothetical protein
MKKADWKRIKTKKSLKNGFKCVTEKEEFKTDA